MFRSFVLSGAFALALTASSAVSAQVPGELPQMFAPQAAPAAPAQQARPSPSRKGKVTHIRPPTSDSGLEGEEAELMNANPPPLKIKQYRDRRGNEVIEYYDHRGRKQIIYDTGDNG